MCVCNAEPCPAGEPGSLPYCLGLPERSARNPGDPDLGGWCDECLFFEKCQEVSKHPPKILTLNLKEKYFLQIYEGIKTEEYREANNYWFKRIGGKWFDVIEICCGYPKRGNDTHRLFFMYHGYRREVMDWINDDKIVKGDTFIIPLRDRLQYPYQVFEKRREVSS